MLEVKDLYREYKPKKGSSVVALDHVSLKFPDTGLIFILGKSGSGKSTLLNVMGGLDKADGGDIIIKGKSSKNFKQGDFDSYRNTYLGFIFQEYNILDEFNVGQNIALAIELQGRKATSDEINKILEEVDLKGYGNRKTNELSGGQKQRVAIARALVKDPDIIFGDEPTGALDSKTGIQVFDTLKKLAEKKLVIVVSHDREFAELYGDRVIELADGKIISDIEKIKVAGLKTSQGVTLIDQSVIKVDKDYELTDLDMQAIKKYLNERKDQERLISLDDSINAPLKRITRIDDLGNKESFKKTDEEAIINKKEDFKSIKSKLSLKNCFKIGGSSLKTKPFRLVITILLAITAFGMFGLADTMGSYDKVNSTTKSIVDFNSDAIALNKEVYYKSGSDYVYTRQFNMNDSDIGPLKEKYGLDFKGVYKISNGQTGISNNFKKSMTSMTADATFASGFYLSSEEEIEELGYTLKGAFPKNTGEIAITKMMYDSFKKYGYRSSYYPDGIDPEYITEDEIIGKVLNVYTTNQEATLKITGIVDTKFDKSRYQELDTSTTDMSSTIINYMLLNQFQSDYQYGYHSLFFTNSDTIKTYSKAVIDNVSIEIHNNGNTYNYNRAASDKNLSQVVLYKNGASKLGDKQFGVSSSSLGSFVDLNQFSIPQMTRRYYNDDGTINSWEIYSFVDANNYLSNVTNLQFIFEYEKNNVDKRIDGLDYTGTFEDYHRSLINKVFTADILNYIFTNCNEIQMTLNCWGSYDDSSNQIDSENYSLSCIVFDDSSTVYYNDELINSLPVDMGLYTFVIAKNTASESTIKQMVKDSFVKKEAGVTVFKVQHAVMPAYNSINDLIETLAQVFLYVGIGFAVFASLMLFNFITISISYKKREIGILRAVGARSKDVFNIFFAESFIISMIAFTFAIVLTFVISIVINNSLVNEYKLMITLLTPGVRQVLLVLAVSLGVAFISTFIPVYKIAMKRPIDAIRDR